MRRGFSPKKIYRTVLVLFPTCATQDPIVSSAKRLAWSSKIIEWNTAIRPDSRRALYYDHARIRTW